MKGLLVILSLLVSGVAGADVPAELQGKWVSARPVHSANGFIIHFGLGYNEDSTLDVSAICKYRGQTLEAIVSVPIAVNEGEIQILGSGENEVSRGNLNCNVNIEPATINYMIKSGKLVLLAPDNSRMVFRRR